MSNWTSKNRIAMPLRSVTADIETKNVFVNDCIATTHHDCRQRKQKRSKSNPNSNNAKSNLRCQCGMCSRTKRSSYSTKLCKQTEIHHHQPQYTGFEAQTWWAYKPSDSTTSSLWLDGLIEDNKLNFHDWSIIVSMVKLAFINFSLDYLLRSQVHETYKCVCAGAYTYLSLCVGVSGSICTFI